MLTVICTPGTTRSLPRSGDRTASRLDATIRAEVVQLNTRLLALEREQHLQFERIAQIQHQLDELTKLIKALDRPTGRKR